MSAKLCLRILVAVLIVVCLVSANQCECIRECPGRACFDAVGVCNASDAKYSSLCAQEKAEDDCDAQTAIGCFWQTHTCSSDGQCAKYCPRPKYIGSKCIHAQEHAARGVKFSKDGRATATGGAISSGGWAPVDSAGVHRLAALGLFDMTPVQAEVTKSQANPLFGQDKAWETRIDNGYPNVVYDEESAARGDGPWRLWYGNIGVGGQYLLYANSSDGLRWDKPDLNRYNLQNRWGSDPSVARFGKNNNIVMFGGGLGIYRDLHEKNTSLRYKISGGAPGGCYDATGDKACLVGTAGSPDGIRDWGDVQLHLQSGYVC